MKRRPISFVAALLLSAGAAFATFVPPTDADIDAAVRAFGDKERTGAESNPPARAVDRIRWADESLEGIDLTSLTPAQINRLLKARLIPMANKSRAIAEHLAKEAQADTIDGAEAAALRLSFLRFEPDPSAQQLIIRRALTHPQLQAALKEGRGVSMFSNLRACQKVMLPELLALENVFTTDMPPEVAARTVQAVDAVVALSGDDDAQTREGLRAKALEVVRAAKEKEIADQSIRDALANAEKKLDGAFMKGTLVGNPAPELHFTWSNTQPPLKTLSDLKGKVVVLDFWATWCGPCIASFPDVKKLQAHYEGYPVVILGVTSLQGQHIEGPKIGPDNKVIAESQVIDCKDDPKKEMELMAGYIKNNELTWKFAFSAEPVYNPEYGITGIPHVVIIDANGNIRHRRLHPNSKATPLSDKIAKIDALLKEAGLPTPPPEGAPGARGT